MHVFSIISLVCCLKQVDRELFADPSRREYIPSLQALSHGVDGHLIRQDGTLVGYDGVHSSEYPWTCLRVPVKQETHQTRLLYDSIYSLPLMSGPPKYQPQPAYVTHDSTQTPLTQRFGVSEGYVGANLLHSGRKTETWLLHVSIECHAN